jgi:hypothetical protein
VIAWLGYSLAGAGALLFSKEAPDILWGVGRCLWAPGGLPATLVWDREGPLHAGGDRASEAFAGFCAGYCGLADRPPLLRDRPLGLSTPRPVPTVRPCDTANESEFLRPRQQSR